VTEPFSPLAALMEQNNNIFIMKNDANTIDLLAQ